MKLRWKTSLVIREDSIERVVEIYEALKWKDQKGSVSNKIHLEKALRICSEGTLSIQVKVHE